VKAAQLAARVLISAIFVQGALGKITGWEGQAAYMRAHGIVWMVSPLLAAALVIEVAGVLSLWSGLFLRASAAVMSAYLVVLSVLLHDFWSGGGAMAGMAQTQFFKNLAIAGGLLFIAASRREERPPDSSGAGAPR
jgi:putative oxidoreductase